VTAPETETGVEQGMSEKRVTVSVVVYVAVRVAVPGFEMVGLWVTVVWLFAGTEPDGFVFLPVSGRGAASAEPARAAIKRSESCMLAEASVELSFLDRGNAGTKGDRARGNMRGNMNERRLMGARHRPSELHRILISTLVHHEYETTGAIIWYYLRERATSSYWVDVCHAQQWYRAAQGRFVSLMGVAIALRT
jgi:hypothetical protein